ncbi:hypothetical protein GGX14DRAFT_407648 [Mycena pura]|uniref:Uncharacterized protein n=1 Tax=Mycena pura TaxID=153505 RepID=A0AAD6Y496_9AGAR|nr:hypothetical protein GGX14DRAFT_407648 [Mycena pura]
MVHQMTEKKALWRGSTRGVGNRESVRLQKYFQWLWGRSCKNLAEQDPPEAVLEREAKRVLASRGQKRYSFTSNSPTSRPQGRSRSRFSETGSTVNQGIGTWCHRARALDLHVEKGERAAYVFFNGEVVSIGGHGQRPNYM